MRDTQRAVAPRRVVERFDIIEDDQFGGTPHPVVYAVLGTPETFPEMFQQYKALLQLNAVYGIDGISPDDLELETVAAKDIPRAAIICRTTLLKPKNCI